MNEIVYSNRIRKTNTYTRSFELIDIDFEDIFEGLTYYLYYNLICSFFVIYNVVAQQRQPTRIFNNNE